MLREKESFLRKSIIVLDALTLSVVFLATFFLRSHFHLFYKLDIMPGAHVVVDAQLSRNDYLVVYFLSVFVWCFVLYLNGMYRSMRTKSVFEIIWIVIKSAFFTVFTFGTIVFLFKLHFVSRIFFAIFLILSFAAILAEKVAIFLVMRYFRKEGYNYRRLLIAGTGRRAVDFIEKIHRHPEWGFKVVGIIDYEKEHMHKDLAGIKVIGTFEDLPRILHNSPIDEVVFIVPRSLLNHVEKPVYVCETEGVKATVALDLFDLKIARSKQTDIEGMPFITFETTLGEEWQRFIKRLFDIIVSGIGIIILSPLFLAVAILIKVTSPGPVLYIQKRVGLNGRKFIFYKFRSMHKGAHEKLSELSSRNEMTGPVFKIKNDPRITPLGKILRKFSIDELPQLFNVFAGEMSLVGPRPPLPKEVAQYKPWQRRRLSMRPGITCLWQISGRNKIGFEEWMKLDLEYIDNWSLWLDYKILFKTVPVVVFGVGAY